VAAGRAWAGPSAVALCAGAGAATIAYLHDSRPLQNEESLLPPQSPPFFTDQGVDSICGSFVSGSTDAVLFYGTSQDDAAYAVELNPGIVPVPRNYGEAIKDPIYGAISCSLVLLYGPRPLSGARRAQPPAFLPPSAASRRSLCEQRLSRSRLLLDGPESLSRPVLLYGPESLSGARRAQPPALYGPRPPRARSLCEQRLSRSLVLLCGPRPLSGARRAQPPALYGPRPPRAAPSVSSASRAASCLYGPEPLSGASRPVSWSGARRAQPPAL
jgi:hypothetical protein